MSDTPKTKKNQNFKYFYLFFLYILFFIFVTLIVFSIDSKLKLRLKNKSDGTKLKREELKFENEILTEEFAIFYNFYFNKICKKNKITFSKNSETGKIFNKENIFNEFKQYFNEIDNLNLYKFSVPADGNCGFSSILFLLFPDLKNENSEIYNQFFNEKLFNEFFHENI